MSNNRTSDELLEEFERMLDSLQAQDDDEEAGHTPFSYPAWGYSIDNDDEDSGEDKIPPIPEEAKCKHKKILKKQLLVSYYFICADCGKEVKDDKTS